MKITQIKKMWWGDEAQTVVGLVADTSDEGTDLQIGTPYDETSIIWEAVQAFPQNQIEAYVAPQAEVE